VPDQLVLEPVSVQSAYSVPAAAAGPIVAPTSAAVVATERPTDRKTRLQSIRAS
jgi:hypothetical protein